MHRFAEDAGTPEGTDIWAVIRRENEGLRVLNSRGIQTLLGVHSHLFKKTEEDMKTWQWTWIGKLS